MPFWDALMQGKADFSPTLLLKVGRLHSLGTFITPRVQNMNERKCRGAANFWQLSVTCRVTEAMNQWMLPKWQSLK